MQPLSPEALVKAGATFVLGLVVGATGTVMHRSVPPWGLVLCLLLVLAAALLARAWAGGIALAGLAGGMFLSVTTLARTGPGGDVLVPAQQGVGWAWVLGAAVALVAVSLAPRAIFRDEPRAEHASLGEGAKPGQDGGVDALDDRGGQHDVPHGRSVGDTSHRFAHDAADRRSDDAGERTADDVRETAQGQQGPLAGEPGPVGADGPDAGTGR